MRLHMKCPLTPRTCLAQALVFRSWSGSKNVLALVHNGDGMSNKIESHSVLFVHLRNNASSKSATQHKGDPAIISGCF